MSNLWQILVVLASLALVRGDPFKDVKAWEKAVTAEYSKLTAEELIKRTNASVGAINTLLVGAATDALTAKLVDTATAYLSIRDFLSLASHEFYGRVNAESTDPKQRASRLAEYGTVLEVLARTATVEHRERKPLNVTDTEDNIHKAFYKERAAFKAMLDAVAASEHVRGLEIWAGWHDTVSTYLSQSYQSIDRGLYVVVPAPQRAAYLQLLVNDLTFIHTFFKL